jgi:hypothetical protein
MKENDLKLTELLKEEAILVNGGNDCSCPECSGRIIGRIIGYIIKFGATVEYGRVPLA